jgi:hypothetical protein
MDAQNDKQNVLLSNYFLRHLSRHLNLPYFHLITLIYPLYYSPLFICAFSNDPENEISETNYSN